jgi:hypothetical protein
MSVLRWFPLIMVLPTFAFIGYWMWRYSKVSDSGGLPRSIKELRETGPKVGGDFAGAGRKLRWLNLWLMVAFIAAAIIAARVGHK